MNKAPRWCLCVCVSIGQPGTKVARTHAPHKCASRVHVATVRRPCARTQCTCSTEHGQVHGHASPACCVFVCASVAFRWQPARRLDRRDVLHLHLSRVRSFFLRARVFLIQYTIVNMQSNMHTLTIDGALGSLGGRLINARDHNHNRIGTFGVDCTLQ